MLREFTMKDFFIDKNSKLLTYEKDLRDEKSYNVHWGQRKLLLSEIEFLTIYWDRHTYPNPVLVYAGSAPGNHIPFLSNMFPSVDFHLYDPRPFKIKENKRISIFQEYFTNKIAESYNNRDDVFFISDIRKKSPKDNLEEIAKKLKITYKYALDNSDTDQNIIYEMERYYSEDIYDDMLMQQEWVLKMEPAFSLLKFKIPYPDKNQEKMYKYLKGHLLIQVWPRNKSSELRLVSFPDKKTKKFEKGLWSDIEYEKLAFYHNVVVRKNFEYKNPLNDKKIYINEPELFNSYDDTAEIFILLLYCEKYGVEKKEDKELYSITLSNIITKELNKGRKLMTLEKLRNSELKTIRFVDQDPFKKKPFQKSKTKERKKITFDISKLKESEEVFIDE